MQMRTNRAGEMTSRSGAERSRRLPLAVVLVGWVGERGVETRRGDVSVGEGGERGKGVVWMTIADMVLMVVVGVVTISMTTVCFYSDHHPMQMKEMVGGYDRWTREYSW